MSKEALRGISCESHEIAKLVPKEILDFEGNLHIVETYKKPIEMDDEVQVKLVQELTPVTGRGFLRENIHSQELYEDVANHVIDCDRLVLSRHVGEVSAFIASSFRTKNGVSVYHLEGIIVEPEFQGSGLALLLLKRELSQSGCEILAFHTQSVKMRKLGEKLAFLTDEEAIEYADTIQTRNRVGFIDVARYGGKSLYGNIGCFRADALPSINFENGDARIYAGKIKKI